MNHALLSSLCYLLLKFVVYVPKGPRWVGHMPSLVCVNPETTTGHTLLLLCQIKFQHYNFVEARVNERLCIREVGVDLELCVHAHGHDVDPIMEASYNNNYFLDKYHLVSVN